MAAVSRLTNCLTCDVRRRVNCIAHWEPPHTLAFCSGNARPDGWSSELDIETSQVYLVGSTASLAGRVQTPDARKHAFWDSKIETLGTSPTRPVGSSFQNFEVALIERLTVQARAYLRSWRLSHCTTTGIPIFSTDLNMVPNVNHE